jgi:arylformamidase
MYGLYPVSLSVRNLRVNFQLDDTINKLSPMKHIDNINMPVILSQGTKETPEFQRQSDDSPRR